MSRVQRIEADDSNALRWGADGAAYEYTDDDSFFIALAKAVNDGIESGDEIEGETENIVADILKATGDKAWNEEDGFIDLLLDIQDCLPKSALQDCPSPWNVKDVSLDCKTALVCYYGEQGEQYFIVPFKLGAGDDEGGKNDPILSAQADWIEVCEDTSFVEKAGRVLSAKNLKLVADAAAALAALASAAKREAEQDAGAPSEAGGAAAPRDVTKFVQDGTDEAEVEYIPVEKASATRERFTLGPLYAPERKDAHGEWIAGDTLQKSLWEYVRESAETGRRINLQHGDQGEITVGEWVECMAWPYDHTIKMRTAGGEEREIEMPAGTVYLGVVWDEEIWPLVEKGTLNGYSLGGRAVKIHEGTLENMARMGDREALLGLEKAASHKFVGKSGGMCKICSGPADNGKHYGIEAGEEATKKDTNYMVLDAKTILQLAAAANAQLSERERELREAELAKTAAAATDSETQRRFLHEAADAIKALALRPEPPPMGDIHVHVPEQNVTINEAGDPLDVLLETTDE